MLTGYAMFSSPIRLPMFRNPLLSAAIALVVVGLGFAFNPPPEKHHESIKQAVAQRSQLAGMLGLGALTAFAASYHSLGVASYTTINDKTVSVGAFGVVMVLKQD